jgi:arylsulfatase A-like enzyme
MSEVVKDKPVWREAFEIKSTETSQALLESVKSGDQEEMRLRARMMASVDEGVGQLFDALEKSGQLDDTFILFLGDNGYFFGEHGLGLERRFAYEEGIRSPFIFRYPRRVKAGTKIDDLVLALDIAPTCSTSVRSSSCPGRATSRSRCSSRTRRCTPTQCRRPTAS